MLTYPYIEGHFFHKRKKNYNQLYFNLFFFLYIFLKYFPTNRTTISRALGRRESINEKKNYIKKNQKSGRRIKARERDENTKNIPGPWKKKKKNRQEGRFCFYIKLK